LYIPLSQIRRAQSRLKPGERLQTMNISAHGIWMFINDREVFLAFEDFPWFEDAPIKKILRVEMPAEDHLYWPDPDVDLDVDSIFPPERYPLVSRPRP
jgi:hypothetical protein